MLNAGIKLNEQGLPPVTDPGSLSGVRGQL